MKLLWLLLFFPLQVQAASIKCTAATAKDFKGKVEVISDGDTIHVKKDKDIYKIRLLGIDTPELHYEGRSQGPWAEKATQVLTSKIPLGTEVSIVYDRSPCDAYGRHLGYVVKGSEDVNGYLIDQGVATNYCIYPNVARCRDYAERMDKSLKTNSFANEIELPYEFRWRTSGRKPEKPVAHLNETEVHEPEYYDQIPIPYRLFFMNWDQVLPPYHK
jgi:micrococcal nuclease